MISIRILVLFFILFMPSFLEFLTLLLSAAGLAGLIGMEREMRIQKYSKDKTLKEPFSAGLRSHSMVGALGFLTCFISEYFSKDLLIPITMGIFITFLISHFVVMNKLSLYGMSSSFSFIASFIIGIFVQQDQIMMALVISLLFTVLLVLNNAFEYVAQKITQDEFFAIVKFLILSFVVLQVLPESWTDPFNFFDWRPQTIWIMIMLVASIRFIGYFLSKIIGQDKSILLSGIIGGLVSSTAVTTGIAQESKDSKKGNIFVIPILVASSIMFIRVIVEIVLVSSDIEFFIPLYVSFGLMAITSLGLSAVLIFWKKESDGKNPEIANVSQPLHLKSALSFGLFFLFILIISEKMGIYFSEQGLLLVGAIAGLTDVDAITLAMAQKETYSSVHLSVIFIAVMVNTLVKIGIVAVFGSKKVLKRISLFLGSVFLVGIASFTTFMFF